MDCRWLGVHPTLRTALAFCEAWPPDDFPITFYRTPTCPDWELEPGALDLAGIAAAQLLYVSGTGLAREPSRLATMAAVEARTGAAGTTVLDLDWRPVLWDDPADYAAAVRVCARMADIALGSDQEIAAAAGANDPAGSWTRARACWCRSTGRTGRPCTRAAARASGSPPTRSTS